MLRFYRFFQHRSIGFFINYSCFFGICQARYFTFDTDDAYCILLYIQVYAITINTPPYCTMRGRQNHAFESPTIH